MWQLATWQLVASYPTVNSTDIFYSGCTVQGFPSGLLNEAPRDSLCGVTGFLIMIQGFVVLRG